MLVEITPVALLLLDWSSVDDDNVAFGIILAFVSVSDKTVSHGEVDGTGEDDK